ncbi:MAG: putative 126 kDa protein [Yunnan virgavirus 3]|nr:MAG: putative 126 kDa protein [Yunnan virgavirus 3]
MAHLQSTMNSAVLDTLGGKNALVNDLARKRVYDAAVDELNARDRRPKVTITKTLTEEQTLMVSAAYPEFQIQYNNTQNAVHTVAAALRQLELEYLMMQVPYGANTYDIGGNFAAHLFKGRDYVHSCAPNLDFRDIMRHRAQKDSIDLYLARLKRAGKVVPPYQMSAFSAYQERQSDIVCCDTFQTCKIQANCPGKVYAIALHSLYDIPYNEFGAALLRKNVDTCYGALHFAEELLLDNNTAKMPIIDAVFSREGDDVVFSFVNESTLCYKHSFKNILGYVTKTYFPASSRYVYMKEHLVTRANTWFVKFVKLDTYTLYHTAKIFKSCDHEEFYTAMEDAFLYKKNLAMLNNERIMTRDSSIVNFWFPKMRDMVSVNLFSASVVTKKIKSESVLVNRDFVFTVLNHIRTYQAKALTYQNVLSFVESIRSRVIINGTTARSEWDVDKEILQKLSMTFYLRTKLAVLQDELILERFKKFDKRPIEMIKDRLLKAVGLDFEPSVKSMLAQLKIIQGDEDQFEIVAPDLYITWADTFVAEYKRYVEEPEHCIQEALSEAEEEMATLSEMSILKDYMSFDLDKFKRMCVELEVKPETAARVIVAVTRPDSGVTLTFQKPTEENVAKALTTSEQEVVSLVPNDSTESVNGKSIVVDATIPCCSTSGGLTKTTFEARENLSDYHMQAADEVRKKSMASVVYTGPTKVQQMANFMDSLSASISATVSNLCKLLRDTSCSKPEQGDKAGVWCAINKRWILEPVKKMHSWGVVLTKAGKMFTVFLQYDKDSDVMICDPEWKRVAVSTDTLVYSDMAKLKCLRNFVGTELPTPGDGKVVLVDGVPGCGKTKEILEKVDFENDLVLVPGREAAEMIRRRANKSGREPMATKENVRTVDSFLMNFIPSISSCQRLFIDEGLMLHPGCVNFLIAMTKCQIAYVYGDRKQIPYINRVQNFPYPDHLAKLQYDEVETRRTTLRCPADVTHFLQEHYEGIVTCTSNVKRSVSSNVLVGKAELSPVSKPLKGKIVTFTQSDKNDMLEKGYKDVHTVHEIQGETYEDVSLVRLTHTPVQIISSKSPHVLVALTRHTKSLKYYTVVVDPVVSKISDLSNISEYLLDLYKVESPTQ